MICLQCPWFILRCQSTWFTHRISLFILRYHLTVPQYEVQNYNCVSCLESDHLAEFIFLLMAFNVSGSPNINSKFLFVSYFTMGFNVAITCFDFVKKDKIMPSDAR